MRSSNSPQRYVLVPRAPSREANGQPVRAGTRPIRRFSLARVGPSPRSALGEDRHARMERAAGHEREA